MPVCTSVSRRFFGFFAAASSRSSSRKITSCGRGAQWIMATSSNPASRSMPITGVMPLPAVRKSTLAGVAGGSTKSPAGWSSRIRVPGAARWTRWLLTLPPGTAFTVIVIRPSLRSVGEVME